MEEDHLLTLLKNAVLARPTWGRQGGYLGFCDLASSFLLGCGRSLLVLSCRTSSIISKFCPMAEITMWKCVPRGDFYLLCFTWFEQCLQGNLVCQFLLVSCFWALTLKGALRMRTVTSGLRGWIGGLWSDGVFSGKSGKDFREIW